MHSASGSSCPKYLQPRPDGIDLVLKVQPRAARNEIVGPLGDALRIRIAAPPVDAAANEALLEFLAEILGCRRRQLDLVQGHKSRHKRIRVSGVALDRLIHRLQPPSAHEPKGDGLALGGGT